MGIRTGEEAILKQVDFIARLDTLLDELNGEEILTLLLIHNNKNRVEIAEMLGIDKNRVGSILRAIQNKAKRLGLYGMENIC